MKPRQIISFLCFLNLAFMARHSGHCQEAPQGGSARLAISESLADELGISIEQKQIIAKSKPKSSNELRTILSKPQQERFAEVNFQQGIMRGKTVRTLREHGVELTASQLNRLNELLANVGTLTEKRINQYRYEQVKSALMKTWSQSEVEQMLGKPFHFPLRTNLYGEEDTRLELPSSTPTFTSN